MKSKLVWFLREVLKVKVTSTLNSTKLSTGHANPVVSISYPGSYALGMTVEFGRDWIISILVMRYRIRMYKDDVPF